MTRHDFADLNREFYASRPSTYFQDRLRLLALAASGDDDSSGPMGDEIAWGDLQYGSEADNWDAQAKADRQRFIVTESQVLLHHAGEALIRMYLAHESNSDCPWLDIAGLIDFAEFRRQLDELAKPIWPPARENAAGRVFMGGVPSRPNEQWTMYRDAAVRFLRLMASRLKADKNLYNAAKHGLTMIAGVGSIHLYAGEVPEVDGVLQLSAADLNSRQAVLHAAGDTVKFLEREGDKANGYTWYRTMRWLDPQQAALLTQYAIVQMDALWTVAKAHYLGKPLPRQIPLVHPDVFDLLRDLPNPGSVQRWRQSVAHEPSGRAGVEPS